MTNHTRTTAAIVLAAALTLSVVDPALRVRGTQGLRVIDTSVMPVIPSGNTNGPTMAMAWRAADIILRDAPQTKAG